MIELQPLAIGVSHTNWSTPTMRTQKRDTSHRTYIKGYQAGFNDRQRSACPYIDNGINQINWLSGWREGREDKRLGYNEYMGQQKVANI